MIDKEAIVLLLVLLFQQLQSGNALYFPPHNVDNHSTNPFSAISLGENLL